MEYREKDLTYFIKTLAINTYRCYYNPTINCSALQFWFGRKLFGPPKAGRISRHFLYLCFTRKNSEILYYAI